MPDETQHVTRHVLTRCPLFAAVAPARLPDVLRALDAQILALGRGMTLPAERLPVVVLSGRLHVMQESTGGQRSILLMLAPGDALGELPAPVSAAHTRPTCAAHAESRVLSLSRALVREAALPERALLDAGLAALHEQNEQALWQKVQLLALRRTRERLMAFLSGQAERQGADTFTLPWTRQELADYLCVDRSAMCTELGHMQTEGVLRCAGRTFTLMDWTPTQR